MSEGGSGRDEVRVRRTPRYSAFLAVGAVSGAIVALALTTTREVDPDVGFLQMFLFLALFGVTIGLLIGGITALVLERVFSRQAATVTVERSEITAPAHPRVAEPAFEALPGDAQAEPQPPAEPHPTDPQQNPGEAAPRG